MRTSHAHRDPGRPPIGEGVVILTLPATSTIPGPESGRIIYIQGGDAGGTVLRGRLATLLPPLGDVPPASATLYLPFMSHPRFWMR